MSNFSVHLLMDFLIELEVVDLLYIELQAAIHRITSLDLLLIQLHAYFFCDVQDCSLHSENDYLFK